MIDLIERSLWTGVEAGLGLITVEALTGLNASPNQTLLVAGVAAILTMLKVLTTGRLAQLKPVESAE